MPTPNWKKRNILVLKKKYPSTEKDVREVRRLRKVKHESEYARAHTATYGVKASKNICPHCGEKGSVWKNTRAKSTEKTRETGLGAVIGRKTITEKDVTKLRCKNCDTCETREYPNDSKQSPKHSFWCFITISDCSHRSNAPPESLKPTSNKRLWKFFGIGTSFSDPTDESCNGCHEQANDSQWQ